MAPLWVGAKVGIRPVKIKFSCHSSRRSSLSFHGVNAVWKEVLRGLLTIVAYFAKRFWRIEQIARTPPTIPTQNPHTEYRPRREPFSSSIFTGEMISRLTESI